MTTERQKNPENQARGRKARAKGQRKERQVLKELGDWLGDNFPPLKRNYSQVAHGGGDCLDLPGYAVEIKGAQRFQSAWFDQAAEQASEGQLPVVVWRKDRKATRIFVEYSLPEFADLIRNAEAK